MVSADTFQPASATSGPCSPSTLPAPADRMTRPPLERMKYIHARLVAGKYPNCASIARHFEVSPRTIQRDFDYMRDRLELPIDYDPGHRGYFYYQPVTSLPTVQMSGDELTSLLVAREALAHYEGSPWTQRIDGLIGKMAQDLDDAVAPELIHSAISFHTTGLAKVDGLVFRQVCDAVLQQREIHFRYRKYRNARPDGRRIRPYHLSCVNGAWHVIGLTLDRNLIRVYSLERIHEVTVTDTRFARPANFSPQEYFDRAFGILVEEGLREVVLRFRGRAAWQVTQRVWHPTQQIIPLGEQGVEMRLRVSCLRELVGWLMGWGEQVTVLEPAELSAQVSAQARKVADLYTPARNEFLSEGHATASGHPGAQGNDLANTG